MHLTLLKSTSLKMFLISFLILFFELICIRWLSSYILYLGYFTNFVLLGSLLGIGAGVLLANKSYRLIKWLPALLFIFLTTILFVRAEVNTKFEDLIYFTNDTATVQLPPYIVLPLIFIGITAIFTMLSQDLGLLFTQFPPLQAYNLNIFGSLAGIACFTLMSFLSLPSWIWFLVSALLIVLFLPIGRSFGRNLFLLLGLVAAIAASDFVYANIWSPYYRLNLIPIKTDEYSSVSSQESGKSKINYYALLANGIGHQEFSTIEHVQPFYQLPYTLFEKEPIYQNALVVGAGSGNDVAVALARGVQQIDAVEIDPQIVKLGQNYHPENPYANPRVTVYTDDARSFLAKTTKKYDIIIFALPDSLVLASTASSLRLESFLFTKEAFESVKTHLKPDGLFVLYNYYRNEWLINKIVSMLGEVFEEPPLTYRYTDPKFEFFATIFTGPKSTELNLTTQGLTQPDVESFVPATDNWPFLYLKEPSLPGFYSGVLAVVLLFSLIYIQRLAPQGAINKYGWPFFFMGCAFTLLETRSIIQFLLLFGATWLVNSLVFFGILLVVLIANWLVTRYKFSQVWILYALLFITLLLNYLIPFKLLLFDNLILRYTLGTLLLFSPIFFANLIFSTIFRNTTQANVAYGANLLGTMVGGSTEYLALYFGYQNLIIFAAIFYFLAFYFSTQKQYLLNLSPVKLK